MITRKMLESGGFNFGYLIKAKSPAIQASFATANAAIRKEVLEQIGAFDESCVTGEDFDLNLRVLNSGWFCYYEPRATIHHRFRSKTVSLLKQWYDYAAFHPYVLKKYMARKFEIYLYGHDGEIKGLSFPFPFIVVLRLTPFYLFHLFLILSLCLKTSSWGFSAVAVLTVIYGIRYFCWPLPLKKPLLGLRFVWLRYLVNCSRFLGGFWAGLRQGMIFFEETWDLNVVPEALEKTKKSLSVEWFHVGGPTDQTHLALSKRTENLTDSSAAKSVE